MPKLLNAVYDRQDDIPEPFRPLFHANREGKFELDEVDDKRLDEFRDSNRALHRENDELKRRLEPFEHVDLAKYDELRQKEQDLRDEKLYKKDKIDEVVNTRTQVMREDFERKLEKASKQTEALERELAIIRIDEAAITAATKLGVKPTAIEDVKNRIKGKFVLEDGKPVAYEFNQTTGKRDRAYGKKGGLLTIEEEVEDISVKAGHLFEPNRGGETPSGRQTGAGTAATEHAGPNPWKNPKNLDECSRIAKANPALANRLRKEAGLPEVDYNSFNISTAPRRPVPA
jgi:hypothetical protein